MVQGTRFREVSEDPITFRHFVMRENKEQVSGRTNHSPKLDPRNFSATAVM